MYRILLLFIFMFSSTINAQEISGIVYDAETTVKGAKVYNKSSQILEYTDGDGNFTINAKVNDTLLFTSFFHASQLFIVRQEHFDLMNVIELIKVVNELDEVDLRDDRTKVYDSIKVENNVQKQIKEDVAKNPHLYSSSSAYGLDLIRLGGLIAGLFKGKNKKHNIIPITYDQFVQLFKQDKLFTDELLTSQLNITLEKKFQFLEFCEKKQFDSNLLKETKEVQLLDSLYNASKEFLVIWNEPVKD